MPASFTATCPHCNAENMTFPVFGISRVPAERPIGRWPYVSAAADCPKCGNPVVAQLGTMRPEQEQSAIVRDANAMRDGTGDVLQFAFDMVRVWPDKAVMAIPASLPAAVARAFTQGEKNFFSDGCEEPAAAMYRRSLELAIGALYPQMKGKNLAGNIKALVKEHELPKSMGDWLDQVRLIGNEGVHEEAELSRESLDDARAFTDTALRYLFTLPAQIKSRQLLRANA